MARPRFVLVLASCLFALGCLSGSDRPEVAGAAADLRAASAAAVLLPSGSDDTAALQAALEAAIASGRPTVIELGPGTFVTGPLHAIGFRGVLRGAGMGVTVLTNPDAPVAVTPVFQPNPPSASNVWPAMIVFVGGDFVVSDLTVHVRGEKPTTGWTVFDLTIYGYAVGIDVEGNGGEVHAVFERVGVQGEPAPDEWVFGGVNIGNGIYFEGLIGFPVAPPLPTSGSFTVLDSEVRGATAAVPTYNLRDARVRIEGNTLQPVMDGTEVGDSSGLDFVFANNRVESGVSAYSPFDLCLGEPSGCGLSNSRIVLTGNEVRAPVGFGIGNAFGEGMTCRIAGNDVTYDEAAVILGEGTHGCVVQSAGTVVDLGTDNRVVGPR